MKRGGPGGAGRRRVATAVAMAAAMVAAAMVAAAMVAAEAAAEVAAAAIDAARAVKRFAALDERLGSQTLVTSAIS
jgi:hypothetical protein